MTAANELAEIGSLIGNPARANMLLAMLDGRVHTGSELAAAVGLTLQTASWHLAQLTDAELVARQKQGRSTYYRLASGRVASMLELALAVATAGPQRHRPASTGDQALRAARTCYDHLAGRLGVSLTRALVRRRHLVLSRDGGELTSRGAEMLKGFGVDIAATERRKRIFCRPCLDWTEQRPHLAGAVGAAIAARCFDLGWIARMRDSRAVSVTAQGRDGFAEVFGVGI
jgi:DNA-binding transcriptional ArsR family regulator